MNRSRPRPFTLWQPQHWPTRLSSTLSDLTWTHLIATRQAMTESDALADGNDSPNPYTPPATDSAPSQQPPQTPADKRLAKTSWVMFANWVFVIALSFPCIGLGLTGQTKLFYALLVPLAICCIIALVANVALLVLSVHSCWTRNRGVWYLIVSLVVPVATLVPFVFG